MGSGVRKEEGGFPGGGHRNVEGCWCSRAVLHPPETSSSEHKATMRAFCMCVHHGV